MADQCDPQLPLLWSREAREQEGATTSDGTQEERMADTGK